MSKTLPDSQSSFVGRQAYITRFKARLEHFRFYIYEGIEGIGKTALVLKLAEEAQKLGSKAAIYLRLSPGEGIHSILARVETRFRQGALTAFDLQGDPYARLATLLHEEQAVLVLDGLHYLRSDELPTLARVFLAKAGDYRVIGTIRGDPDLSAMDLMALHYERVGGFQEDEVADLIAKARITGDAAETLLSDAKRNGCAAHPLTLRYIMGLWKNDVPPATLFERHSVRSVMGFRAVLEQAGERLSDDDRSLLGTLMRIGPIDVPTAYRAFGEDAITRLIDAGLVSVFDGDIEPPSLLASYMELPETLPVKPVRVIAKRLEERAVERCEPMEGIRAGQLMALAGDAEGAVNILASRWEAIRDLGFLEAYLKALAGVPADDDLAPRLRVLSARARMRQRDPGALLNEMETLAAVEDPWTQARALSALTYIYHERREEKKALASFQALQKISDDPELVLVAGGLAASAMLSVGRVEEAEELARKQLKELKKHNDKGREGELHRLLAQIHGGAGRLNDAVKEAQAAADCFEAAGDLYHAATALGFIGDLYRESGAFEEAREAFEAFGKMAERCGDRNLIYIAELADAWVSLDIGDVTRAAKQMAAVTEGIQIAPSGRLKRYLAAARALLEAGRGNHDTAVVALERVIEAWPSAAKHRPVVDFLRAHRVRSLIAHDALDEAQEMVDEALERLDRKTAGPRVASFLRERGVIKLRRHDVTGALKDLRQARKIFAEGDNRREEVQTLHRLARAAVEEGDLKLAAEHAQEALELAEEIKHKRAAALAREVLARIALLDGRAKDAITLCKAAAQSLRRLGDELGSLQVSEDLLYAYLAADDVANALKLGPKLREEAERLELRELRIRSIVLTGVALFKRGHIAKAARCFKELPPKMFSAWTRALMLRFGEAMASEAGDEVLVRKRRKQWSNSLSAMPEKRRDLALLMLGQLHLPPQERCMVITSSGSRVVGGDELSWLLGREHHLVINGLVGTGHADGADFSLEEDDEDALLLLQTLLVASPEAISFADAAEAVYGEETEDLEEKPEKAIRHVFRDLQAELKPLKGLKVVTRANKAFCLEPQVKKYLFMVPIWMALPDLSEVQRDIVRYLAEEGMANLQKIQQGCELNRTETRRELNNLIDDEVIESVKDGRSQAYRLV